MVSRPWSCKLVGLELGHEADAAALLIFVEEDAGAGFGDGGEGELELLAAVAAEGVEDVTGEALGVDADDGRYAAWMSPMTSAMADSMRRAGAGMLFVAGFRGGDDALEAEDAEMSPAGGEVGIGELGTERKGIGLYDYTEVGCSACEVGAWGDSRSARAFNDVATRALQPVEIWPW